MRRRRLVALGIETALLAGCTGDADRAGDAPPMLASASAATPAYGDTYIDSLLGDISSLIPTITSDGSSHAVGGLI